MNSKKILMGLCGLSLLLWSLGCAKLDSDFKDFLADKEIVYTGAVGKVTNLPGNLRTELKWKASSDPSITRYVVYWNEKRDSLVVPLTGSPDSIRVRISGLEEYSYTFTIHSFDAKGNKSIPTEVNNVKVYGNVYTNNLLNRPINADQPYLRYTESSTILNFLQPDTINIRTVVRYENRMGQQVEKEIGPTVNTLELTDYKQGGPISYKSFFIPEIGAIDTFAVNDFDVFPEYTFQNVECPKNLFKEEKLAFDVGVYNGDECPVRKLWDGSVGPQGYPNIFHSAGDSEMPHAFTFNLGAVYDNLVMFEETGRDCCGNPTRFEVWGIASLENAAPTVKPNESGWTQQMQDKGWTLLKEAVRNDDGKAAVRFSFIENPPPVQYIRIRITQVENGGNTSNMSELTFWNRE